MNWMFVSPTASQIAPPSGPKQGAKQSANTMQFKRLTIDEGAIHLAMGAITHKDIRPLLSRLQLPVCLVQSSRNAFVDTDVHSEPFLQAFHAMSVHESMESCLAVERGKTFACLPPSSDLNLDCAS